MTESDWLAAADPELMLDALRDRTTDRKYRCFALACLPVTVPFLYDARSRHALGELARIVEGKTSPDELHTTWQDALAALGDLLDDPSEQRWYYVSVYAADGVALALNPHSGDNISGVAARCCHTLVTAGDAKDMDTIRVQEHGRQIHLIQDIFGNPFRPSPPLPPAVLTWNDAIVRRIAEGIYDQRRMPEGTLDNSRLAILHDALLDAGCDNEELLTHLRSEGTHVRGCWAIDLLLAKG